MNWTFPLQVTVVLFHPTDHLVAAVAIELLCAWRQTECVEQLGSIETLDLVAVSAGYPQDIPRMSPGCPQDVPNLNPLLVKSFKSWWKNWKGFGTPAHFCFVCALQICDAHFCWSY